MNIVLIGMRGSGKTTVAKMLAERLGWTVVELDEEIAKEAGISIRDMVAQKGWDYFRGRESEAVEKAARMDRVVISTGGGVVVRDANIATLKKNGVCVFLNASVDSLFRHVGGDASQLPRLTGNVSMREELEEVLKVRQPLYEEAADEIVNTDTFTTLESVVGEVECRLQKRGTLERHLV